ncbi:MAG: glycoside hydrolase family 5 protein [Opitutales bacterium]
MQIEFHGKAWPVRGVNLGSWLNIEHFMIGLPGVDWELRVSARELWGQERAEAFFRGWLEHFITAADLAHIAQMGFNTVRLPFAYRHLESDDAPGVYDGEGWQAIANCLDWAEANGLAVLLDLHAAPGGQNTTQPADNRTGFAQLWQYRHFQDQTVALWEELTRRFHRHPALLGYNPFNEPIVNNHGPQSTEAQAVAMNTLYARILEAIRSIDPKGWLVMEAPVRSSGGCRWLEPHLFADPRTAFSYHHYPLASHEASANFEAHQAEQWTPEALDRFLRGELADERAFADRVKRPVILGEFGWGRRWPNEHAEPMIAAQLRLAEDLGWGWLQWSYKDVGAMGLMRPYPNCAWRQFTDAPDFDAKRTQIATEFKRFFDHTIIAELDKGPHNFRVYDAAYDDCTRGCNRALRDFRMRQLADKTPEELEAFTRDFRLENCVRHEALFGLLKRELPNTP